MENERSREYREKHKDELIEKCRTYHKENRENILEHKREYTRHNLENIRAKVTCSYCSRVVGKDTLSKHRKTKYCQEFQNKTSSPEN